MSRASFRYTATRWGADVADWRDNASCRDQDPELFFSVGEGASARAQDDEAKSVCDRCPVVAECLDWAIDAGVDDGIWGAMTPAERRAFKKSGRQAVVS